MEKKKKTLTKNIPIEGDFMKKNIDDRIYGYLQLNSYKGLDKSGNEIYFVYKQDNNITVISKKLKINRRTVGRKIENLVKAGYIEESVVLNKKGDEEIPCYIIKRIDLAYQKIDYDTLKLLVYTTQDYVIKIYVYLLNAIYRNPHYEFTYKELMSECLGIKSTHNARDYDIVKSCLELLIRLKLLKLTNKKKVKYIDGKQKTFYFVVEQVKTKLDKIENIEEIRF